mmetsp:Transcript_26390/g.83893  ORF Transcript_26390/g.83893 Transcript_26390/m.83893 type:complete len:414 (-) Transcript_26390:1607-2848(-)
MDTAALEQQLAEAEELLRGAPDDAGYRELATTLRAALDMARTAAESGEEDGDSVDDDGSEDDAAEEDAPRSALDSSIEPAASGGPADGAESSAANHNGEPRPSDSGTAKSGDRGSAETLNGSGRSQSQSMHSSRARDGHPQDITHSLMAGKLGDDHAGAQVGTAASSDAHDASLRASEQTLEQVVASLPRSSGSNANDKAQVAGSGSLLESILLGHRCEVFDDATAIWQGATLEAYADEANHATVSLIHNGEEKKVDPRRVRPIRGKAAYDKTRIKIGMSAEARFSGDGKWYSATILRVTPQGCQVEYEKYRTEEAVAFEHLKPDLSTLVEDDDANQLPTRSKIVAAIPRHLQVKEGDSQQVVERKKRKMDQLRKETNRAQKSLILDQKQQGWQAFQAKSGKKKKKKKPKSSA